MDQIKELVRGSVEETLNGLLEAEAQQLTNAAKEVENGLELTPSSSALTERFVVAPVW